MTPKQALSFVKINGIVLESGRGPVPSLAQTIVGKPIRGNWWAHPKGNMIFLCSRAIRNSKDVLVCRLIGVKITYVHRRLWPALVTVALFFAEFVQMTFGYLQNFAVHVPLGTAIVVTVALMAVWSFRSSARRGRHPEVVVR